MSLLDRTQGFTAEQVRRRLGFGYGSRISETEARLLRLERTLAFHVRHFQGLKIEDPRVQVVPDRRGFISLSTDDNAQWTRDPNTRPDHAKLSVDVETGCGAAIIKVKDCDDTTQEATVCTASLQLYSSDDTIGIQHTGSANAQALDFTTCFPETEAPTATGDWSHGVPATWAILKVGDPCTGGCTEYAIPLFTPRAT